MPLLMTYLLLPIVLHTETRKQFPATTKTSLTSWLGQHPQIHLGLLDRITSFRSITSEAVRFAISGGILKLTSSGELIGVPRKPANLPTAIEASAEVTECFKVVKDLGRWFARVPDEAFLFRLFRLQP